MQAQIQKFGRALSAMVMPNIGAFIAWGLITAIFMSGGWWPNEKISLLISPMLKYMLPMLIAYTAGKNVSGVRGGVAGAVAAMGVIVGSDTPMFIGAMLMGPLAGYCVKKFDGLVKGKVHSGFEMLVDNFSLGIIAMILAIFGHLLIGYAVSWVTGLLSSGVNWMLAHKLNPLLAVLVDPAKVLFLNNAVNHGIMTPLGIQQAAEMGQSMLFLIDPNPGPGLGMLLACWVFGKGTTKQSAPGAAVIQLFGGIHEIYFPYVLARPVLLLAVMAGNVCALIFFTIVDFGLVAPASPGSIISIILMSPKGKLLIGILGVLISTAVSFLLSWPMIKSRPDFQGEEESRPVSGGNEPVSLSSAVRKIVFACDAGMGSSALGATRFKSRLMKSGCGGVLCTNSAVGSIPSDASVVVCQKVLAERARKSAPYARVVEIENFLSDPSLDALLAAVVSQKETPAESVSSPSAALVCEAAEPSVSSRPDAPVCEAAEPSALILRDNVLAALPSESKEEAILRAGRLLASSGYVDEEYADAMLEREKLSTTYMGMGLAIPHGTSEAKQSVRHSGVVVLQYPDGVDFDGEKAYLLIGIAGVGDEHLSILSRVSEALDDEDVLSSLYSASEEELWGFFAKIQ